MKIKYLLTLMAIMIILISLSAVSASENITDTVSIEDTSNSYSSVSEDTLNRQTGTAESVDLSVVVNATPSYVNGKYNTVGSEVPWTITVSAKGGTAHNTKILEVISNNLQYVSHSKTMGDYNPETKTWTIGDLKDSETASLTVITKLKSAGTYVNKVYAITDTKEKNLLNNFVITKMKTGSSKVTSSVTETSDDREGSQHTVHQASMGGARFIIWDDETEEPQGGPDPQPDPHPYQNGTGASQQNTVSKAVSLENILNPGNNQTGENFSPLPAYDYAQIPIIIFTVFIIMLTALVGYDKIKSRSNPN